MKYRHAFHAGNFADVHKHIMLLSLLRALCRKDKGFLLLDTHSGRGFYDLSSSEAYRSHEADEGIERLLDVAAPAEGWPTGISDYIAVVETMRRERHDRAAYPGSPLLALLALRPQDRTVLIETQPSEHAALREAVAALARYAPAALTGERRTVVERVVIECADGYGRLPNWLPPIERRALVFIDPPYEDGVADQRAVEQALVSACPRPWSRSGTPSKTGVTPTLGSSACERVCRSRPTPLRCLRSSPNSACFRPTTGSA